MKMQLQDALAILTVHAGKIHNPPLSTDDTATLMRAMQVVRSHADAAMKARRPSPPRERRSA